MFYKKTERYSFSCPKEYRAYTRFKDDLKNMGISFREEDSTVSQTVIIETTGAFDVSENGYILKMEKEG